MTTFVLIHGAFFAGWCWDEVAGRLRAAGHEVLAPTLSGLSDLNTYPTKQINLERHIEDTVCALDSATCSDIVLVGHSYGGMPVIGAADRRADRIATLVLLDAFAPRDGESVLTIRQATGRLPGLTEDEQSIAPPDIGLFGLKDRADEIAGLLRPQPLGTWQQPIRLTGRFTQIPRKHYARLTHYDSPYFDEMFKRLATQQGWTARQWPHHHCPMITDPDWTVRFLTDPDRLFPAAQTPPGQDMAAEPFQS